MIAGTEWIVDANGCKPEALRDLAVLKAVFHRVVTELRLQIVDEIRWHQFPPPGGLTGMALLSESHLTCHTYPEYGLATINLYCCRSRPEWPWAECLRDLLGAQDVTVRAIERQAAMNEMPPLEHPLQFALAKES
ncbi:MAG: adenosylmethionine decarboxylase [Acidobacteriota bacterium]|nr:adenosylmethionine decarboxylase [Acidobacteriota bacterium]